MMSQEDHRSRTAYVLIGAAFVLVVLNGLLLLKLNDLISTNYKGCLSGNVTRADARLLLNESGHTVLAQAPELKPRPCHDLYGKGLRP